jgi:hypothetical protein
MFNATRAYELNVLVAGKPITEYQHNDNIFVEGRKGSEFEVEFKNKTGKQVLVVPSVDGKSVLDGKPATPESRGYVVRAWGSIRIPGWTLDSNDVAKFTFEDKEKSYAAQTVQEGEAVQSGVIGVLVYSEVEKPKPVHYHHYYQPRPQPTWPRSPYDPFNPQQPWWSADNTVALGGTADSAIPKGVMRGMSASATATLSASTAQANNSVQADSIVSNPAPLENAFEMGAGFGERSQFKTQEVSFERGPVVATMVLYYDSRRNLQARGIEVVKKEQRHINDLPQAFAGVGCTPPPGWQG